MTKMAFAEIEVDQKYHRHIIGRNGANGEYKTLNSVEIAVNAPLTVVLMCSWGCAVISGLL